MRGTIYVFMSLLLLTFIGCNNNDELVDNQENVESSFFQLIENTNNLAAKSSSAKGVVIFQTDLMAGQHYVAGSVTISVDKTDLTITYSTNDDWVLNETHLYAGEKDLIPVTKKGNPKIGKFPYKGEHDGVNEFSYSIPLADLKDIECFTVAAHAVVTRVSSKTTSAQARGGKKGRKKKIKNCNNDGGSGTETAWGAGTPFAGRSWAMYTSFCDDPGNGGGGEGGGGNDTN